MSDIRTRRSVPWVGGLTVLLAGGLLALAPAAAGEAPGIHAIRYDGGRRHSQARRVYYALPPVRARVRHGYTALPWHHHPSRHEVAYRPAYVLQFDDGSYADTVLARGRRARCCPHHRGPHRGRVYGAARRYIQVETYPYSYGFPPVPDLAPPSVDRHRHRPLTRSDIEMVPVHVEPHVATQRAVMKTVTGKDGRVRTIISSAPTAGAEPQK